MKSNILVVDDIPQNLQLMGSILRTQGYNVAVAVSGEQALSLVEKVTPDLVLLDIMMPKMNGYEVAKRLKEDPRFTAVPIIFLSGKVEAEDIIAGFEAGGADYVTKPFNQAELMARVRTHIQLKHSADVIKQQYEAILSTNNALGEANASKDKLLSIIAHDIRSPFSGIIGLTEMLQSEDINSDPVAVKEMAEAIHQSAKNVYTLLDELLEYAKSSMGMMEYKPAEVSLASIAESSAAIVEATAISKNIEIVIDNSLKGKAVFTDRNIANTICRNLLSNAIKFSNPNSKVIMLAREDVKGVFLDVQDTGVGMDADTLGKLFRTDQKVTSLGTNNEKGSGYGLLLCKNLAERQGGMLTVKSTLGEGSTFSLLMPVKPIEEAE